MEPGDQSAAVSLGLAATSERTVGESTSARDRLFENACESGDVATVQRLLAEGANPNFEVSSRIQPGKPVYDLRRESNGRWILGRIRGGDPQG